MCKPSARPATNPRPRPRPAAGLLGLLAWALAALGATAAAHAEQVTRYTIRTGDGRQSGEQVVTQADDGWTTVQFSYRDNGRGPDLKERFRLGPDGLLAELQTTGATEMGSVVDEQFSRTDSRATWRTAGERGEATGAASQGAQYVPLNGSFEMVSQRLAALAARPDGRLPLLPSGVLTQRVLDRFEWTQGPRPVTLQLLALTGLGFTPDFVWATTDARPRVFAVVYPGWFSFVEAGFDGLAEALGTRQQQAEGQLLKDLAQQWRQPLVGLTVVRNARVFDSERARLNPASDIYILRGRITAVRPAGTPGPRGDGEIDAAGRVALPGLFDMHAHIGRWDGGLHLAAGVTTVRDLGNNNATLQAMMDEAAAGAVLLPSIVPTGFLEGDSPFASRNGVVIKTLQEAKDAVDWYATHGYVQLKIYNSFPRSMVREITAYAHARGLRVSGHVPYSMRASEVIDQGYDEIQHINQVLLNFLVKPDTDTRTLERFYLPAEKLAALDLDSPPVRRFMAQLLRRKTVVDPTLGAFSFIRHREGEVDEPYRATHAHLPPDVQRSLRQGGMKIPDDATAARYAASYRKMVAFVGRMYRAGVPLVAGTDDTAGLALHNELELYVQAGLTPAQALQVATRNGARYTGTASDRGRIAAGQRADLLLVDGEPTRQIGDVRKVALVITQGGVITPNAVHQALGIRPFVQDPPVLRVSAAPAQSSRSLPVQGGPGSAHRYHAH